MTFDLRVLTSRVGIIMLNASIPGLLAAGFLITLESGTAWAANCSKNPDHPHCDGGGGGGNSDVGNETVVRIQFDDLASHYLKSGVVGSGTTACSDDGFSQYWLTTTDFVDGQCQGNQPIATMAPGLTGSVGLWFETHTGDDTLGDPPDANRYFEINFSGGIDDPTDPDPAPGCPDIDTLYYGEDTDPRLADFAPPANDAECIDNVEGRLRAGSEIFDYPEGTIVEGPNIQIRIPIIRTNKKGTEETFAWFPQYMLVFDSLIVRADPPGEPADQTVVFECGGAGHDCRANLSEGGIAKGPEATPFSEWGDYEVPFRITVRRASCSSDGSVCDVTGAQ